MARGELIVDLFAGGGGASLGIEMALGRSPDLAVNHDAVAVAMHEANHPDTVHLRKNVWQVHPLEHIKGQKVGLLWASPDCTHHSKAKGGKPVKKNIRDLAWVVVLWAQRARPRIIMLENVEEFRDWGPLGEDQRPDKARKGQTFDKWVRQIRNAGYRVQWRELRACDYGAPTIRKRLFVIARCDGQPIVWPEPTHGHPDCEAVQSGKLKPWRTAAEVIDWSRTCHSIFLSREEARGVGVKRPLAPATMARIAKGVKRYVLDNPSPFIVSLTHQGGDRAESIAEPMRTVTGAHRGEKAVVAPVLAYGQQGGSVRAPDDPLHTITASRKDTNAVIGAFVHRVDHASAALRNGVQEAEEALRTITSHGGLAVAGAFMVPRYGERPATDTAAAQEPRTRDLGEPIATIVPDSNEGHLVAPLVTKFRKGSAGAAIDAPLATVTANSFEKRPGGAPPIGLVAAAIVKHNFGDKPAHAADEPLHTITTQGNKHGVVAAFLAQHNTDMVGHHASEPVSTIVGKGCTQAVVSAGLQSMKGRDRRDGPIDGQVPTITAQGWHLAEVRAFLLKYYGTDQDPRLEEPLHTVTSKDRFGLVTVQGEDYVIVDIGMRMLAPRELFAAQGFVMHGPGAYQIDRMPDGTPITKTDQIRMVGNSVSPPVAFALAAANCSDLAVRREAAE